ncbi:hypothetical protein [Streptomyces chartreusis]|uniref:hypothetical protein n=1 Tax=Streptomyces chartreusis TaxID=1969 RepID=UPI00362BE808
MTTRTLSPAAYDRLTAAVARDTGERRTAALWSHAAALARHAHEHGLAPADDRPPGPDGLLKSLENLAGWPGTGSKRVRTSRGAEGTTPPRVLRIYISVCIVILGSGNAPPHQPT